MSPQDAVAAIEAALSTGFDPETDPPRAIVAVDRGQLLLMPSQAATAVGTKVATVAPGNPDRGLDRIQALYIHFDAETLTPRLLVDGTALTTLRTPAVSVVAIKSVLLSRATPLDVVVFGAGPQGVGHGSTIRGVVEGHREIASMTYVVRHPNGVTLADLGSHARLVAAGSADTDAAVAGAGLIVCATGSAVPLFDAANTRDDVIVVAVGSHESDRREVDASLCGRAQVVVESRSSALRECGDVVLAIREGVLDAASLVPMVEVVAGRAALDPRKPTFFKGSGMAWQDVVVAEALAGAL